MRVRVLVEVVSCTKVVSTVILTPCSPGWHAGALPRALRAMLRCTQQKPHTNERIFIRERTLAHLIQAMVNVNDSEVAESA
jgi:hypothetical protein